MELSKKQLEIVNSKDKNIVVIASAASGKAQPNSIRIPTPDGYKTIGDLKVGDKVFNRFGESETILKVFPQGKKQVYKVTFADGRATKCCGEHLWSYYDDNEKLQTEELQNMYNNEQYKYRIPLLNKPIEYQEKIYDISPYLISWSGKIPEEYLLGSIKQRLDVLRGLIDCIGTSVHEKMIALYPHNTEFANNILELTRSLGIYSVLHTVYKENKKPILVLYISIGIKELTNFCFSLQNFSQFIQDTQNKTDYITNIEKTEEYEEMSCILVDDPEHLYLTNNFIVTHNTKTLTARVEHLLNTEKINPEEIVVITFTNAAAEEMRERLGNPRNIFIGTIHSYANYLLVSNGVRTDNLIKAERFDELFIELEKNPAYFKKVKYLFLDEAQDSNELQFNFILNLIQPESFFMVGDFKQCIYEWNLSRPDILKNIVEREDVKVYELNENYRNGKNILEYAKTLLLKIKQKDKWMIDNTVPMKKNEGQVIELEYNLKKIVEFVKNKDNYGDWFILTRTNAQLNKVYNFLKEENIPCSTFKKSELNSYELNQKLKQNTVKVLSIHTSKGLENKNVVVIGANFRNNEECRIAYVAATRAKELLIFTTSKKKINKSYYKWI